MRFFEKLFKLDKEYAKFEQDYKTKKIRYSDLKEVLAQGIFKELQPFQEKRKEFENNPDKVLQILESSEAKARELAQKTLDEVKTKMGLPQ